MWPQSEGVHKPDPTQPEIVTQTNNESHNQTAVLWISRKSLDLRRTVKEL